MAFTSDNGDFLNSALHFLHLYIYLHILNKRWTIKSQIGLGQSEVVERVLSQHEPWIRLPALNKTNQKWLVSLWISE